MRISDEPSQIVGYGIFALVVSVIIVAFTWMILSFSQDAPKCEQLEQARQNESGIDSETIKQWEQGQKEWNRDLSRRLDKIINEGD